MSINNEMMKELESFEPDELVTILGISSEQIIRAFPGHAYDYIRDNFVSDYNEDWSDEDGIETLETYQDELPGLFDEGS